MTPKEMIPMMLLCTKFDDVRFWFGLWSIGSRTASGSAMQYRYYSTDFYERVLQRKIATHKGHENG